MKIPWSPRKKALIVVDVQPSFLNTRNQYVVENIMKLVKAMSYEAYVEATFHAERGSLWDIQQEWICPEGEETQTLTSLSAALAPHNPLKIHKTTKSVFKGDKNVLDFLKGKNIEEVHIVGVDTNDCVLATAYEAFDNGFVTYVIEECAQSSSSNEVHEKALDILRHQNMTNNASIEKFGFLEI